MKRLQIFFIFFLFAAVCDAQYWIRTFNESAGNIQFVKMTKSMDGGYLITGNSFYYGQSKNNLALVKTNSEGVMVWQRIFGTDETEYSKDIIQVANGDIFVLAQRDHNSFADDIILFKFDSTGAELWRQIYSGTNANYGNSIVADGNDVVILGNTSNSGNGLNDVWLFKVSNAGSQLWSKNYGTTNNEIGADLCHVHNGGFLIVGNVEIGQQEYVYLVRTNNSGDTLWTRTLQSPGLSTVKIAMNSIVELKGDSTFVLAGMSDVSYGNLTTIKVDMVGQITNIYESDALADAGLEVVPTEDGGYMVLGVYSNFGNQITLSKFLPSGNFFWSKRYFYIGGVSYYSYFGGGGLIALSGDDFILAGRFMTANGSKSFLMKLDQYGEAYTGNAMTPVITGPANVCAGTSGILSVPDAYQHYQWIWFNRNQEVTYLNSSNNHQITVDSSGTYKCIMWSDDMFAISNDVSFTVSDQPDTSMTITGNLSFCDQDENLKIGAKQNPGTSYSWSLNGTTLPTQSRTIFPSISGSYQLTVSNVCGTLSSAPFAVNANTIPLLKPGPDTLHISYQYGATEICDKKELILNISASTSCEWYNNGTSTGVTLNEYTAELPGNYYAILQNSCGTFYSDTTIIVYDTIYTPLTYTAGMYPDGCANHNLKLSAPNGGDFYYWYKNGVLVSVTTNNYYSPGLLTTLDSGYYHCRIYDNCGSLSYNYKTDSIWYRENSLNVNVTVIGGNTVSCTGDTIYLSVNFPGTPVQWYRDNILIPGAISSVYGATTTGSYHCLLTIPSCGQANSTKKQLVFSPPINATITTTKTAICRTETDTTDVKLKVDDSVFTGALTYQWRYNGVDIPGATNIYYETKMPGQYICRFTNSCGSVYSNSILITNNYLPKAITPALPTRNCKGVNVQISVTPGFSYQWIYSQNGAPSSFLPGINSNTYTTNVAGNYHVRISNIHCEVYTNIASLLEQPLPSPNFIFPTSPPSFCGLDSVKLEANKRADYTYQWYKDGALIPGAIGDSIYGNGVGSYSVVISDSLNCNSTSPPQLVSNASVGTIPLSLSATSNFCIGDTAIISSLYSFSNYQWYYNGNLIAGANSSSISVDSSGQYSLSVTDATGCNGTGSVIVNFDSPPSVTSTVVLPDPCNSSKGKIKLLFDKPVVVVWTGPGGTPLAATSTGNESELLNLAAGWYTYTASLPGGGCSGALDSVEVLATANFIPQITTNNTTGCQGTNLILNGGFGYPQYLWSTGSTSFVVNATASGMYVLTVSDPVTGCSGMDSIYVTILPAPNVNIIASDTTVICPGDTLMLDAGPGFSQYVWSTGAISQTIQVFNSGLYVVTVTDPVTLCTNKDTVVVSVLPAPQILLSPSGNVSACQGDTITLQTTPGYSGYLWNTGSTSTFIDVTTSGTYTVTVSGTSSSCVTSSSASFIFNPLPTISLSANGPTNFCVGDSVLITATGSAGNYQWLRNQIPIPGANSSSFMVKGRGFYQCNIIDSNGCSAVSNAIIVRTPCVPPLDPIDKIQVSSDELQLIVYPNPGSGQFTFEVIGDIIPKGFVITDLSGRKLFSETLKELNNSRRYHFDISNYPSGVHILMVIDEVGKSHYLKLVKL